MTRSQMELEIEFNRHGTAPRLDRYHLHTKCFAAWEAERKTTGADERRARRNITRGVITG